jgi:hypothetical protein
MTISQYDAAMFHGSTHLVRCKDSEASGKKQAVPVDFRFEKVAEREKGSV